MTVHALAADPRHASAAFGAQGPDAAGLAGAINRALLAHGMIAARLDPGHPPADAAWGAALHYYQGPTEGFAWWAAWSALSNLKPFVGVGT